MSVNRYLILLVCIALDTSAQQTGDRCCFPDEQFRVLKGGVTATTRTGFLGFVFGQTSLTEEHDSVYDFTNNRFATFITRTILDPNYVEEHVQVIEEPGKDYVWVIDLYKKRCLQGEKDYYPFHLERCIPDYYTYGSTYYMGNGEFFADTYSVVIPKPSPYYGDRSHLFADGYYVVIPREYPAHGVYSVSMSQQCLPLSETFIGHTNSWKVSQNMASSMGFYNYTVGIENPEKYFTVPDYCKNEVEKEDNSIFSWW
ncbi:uncharacterized protein [Amphiura filiformis]|uniref:uncharacterized protein n=1 Tax=Amphiura filiformis TaxID=82378 RepID=UPI003B21EDD2